MPIRSRNAAGAIQRVDFRPRVLVVRISTGVSCRVMDVAADQQIVDTEGERARAEAAVPARRARGRWTDTRDAEGLVR